MPKLCDNIFVYKVNIEIIHSVRKNVKDLITRIMNSFPCMTGSPIMKMIGSNEQFTWHIREITVATTKATVSPNPIVMDCDVKAHTGSLVGYRKTEYRPILDLWWNLGNRDGYSFINYYCRQFFSSGVWLKTHQAFINSDADALTVVAKRFGMIRLVTVKGFKSLTHWGRDKMDAISQTTFSNAFSWMRM